MSGGNKPRWMPFRRCRSDAVAKCSNEAETTATELELRTSLLTTADMPVWSKEPKPLKKVNWVTFLFAVGDVILVLVPIYFIMLGSAAAHLHHKAVYGNSFGSKVTAAMQLGPTIFPIMFAAICGRSMKMTARYIAEKGAKLSTLELLMASQSVWATFESQLLMRRLTVVGANLLFLWSLSPLGGQASLRLLSPMDSMSETFKPLRYLSTGPGSAAWAIGGKSGATIYANLNQAKALYAAAVLGPDQVKMGYEDTWGNVKIPYLDTKSAGKTNSTEWTHVGGVQSPEDFASLVGIPVIGRQTDRDSQFSLETTQMTVECKPFSQLAVENVTDYATLERLVPGVIWGNMSDDNTPWGEISVTSGARSSFFLQSDLPLDRGGDKDTGRFSAFTGFINSSRLETPFPKRKLTYASSYGRQDSGATTLNVAECSLGQIHTETLVKCTKKNCAAEKIRLSLTDHRDPNVTPFDNEVIASSLLSEFSLAFGSTSGSSLAEKFLYNTTSFWSVTSTTSSDDEIVWVNLASLSPEVFSKRLALLLNTFYQLPIVPNAYLGSLPSGNYSAYGKDTLPVNDANVYLPPNITTTNSTYSDWSGPFFNEIYSNSIYFVGATANSTVYEKTTVYGCAFVWVAILVAASSIILILGVASLVLKCMTLGPEMFGSVASLTYDNPYFDLPKGGSVLDAMERSKLMRDTEVFVGDVCGNDEVGHIAFAAGVPQRKLDRSRLYY